MRRFFAAVVACVTVLSATVASAQVSPDELKSAGFFGPSLSGAFDKLIRTDRPVGDKDSPYVIATRGVLVVQFAHQGEPIVVLSIPGKVDFSAAIALPGESVLVLNDWLAVFSRKDVTLATGDFPAVLRPKLGAFWPSGQVKLLGKGFVMRAEPSGDFLDAAREFLMLDRIDGKTVVGFEKNSMRNTTALMLWGTITQPFGIDMTLTNPEIGFTKKEAKPNPTISLASNVKIYGHDYEFKAEASKKVPDIFVLKTDSLTPQDLANIEKALSKPLFGKAMGTAPGWKFDNIPTFSLRPPRTASPNFPAEDQQKVVIYSALPGADRPDWGVKGPGIKIRARLVVDLLPTKADIALVEVAVDTATFSMSFVIPNFKIPKSDLSFGTASAQLGSAAAGSFMRISAESGTSCYRQKYAFTVDHSGIPKLDAANSLIAIPTPASLMDNMKACANDGQKAAEFALKTGEALYGFGRDQLLGASTSIFGAEFTAFAAKTLGYPVALVSSALAKAGVGPEALLNVGKKVYDFGGVGEFAKDAGIKAVDVADWAIKQGLQAPGVGTVLKGGAYLPAEVMGVATKYFPNVPIAGFLSNSGVNAEQYLGWAKSQAMPAAKAGEWFGSVSGPAASQLLGAASKVFGSSEVAAIGKAASVPVGTVVTWFVDSKQFTSAQIGSALSGGQYVAKDVLNALSTRIPVEDLGLPAKQLGMISEDFFAWTKDAQFGPQKAAKAAKAAYDQILVLYQINSKYGLGQEETAEVGRLAGYAADQVGSVFKRAYGFNDKGVASVLRAGGYAQNEVVGALKTVFSVGEDSALKAWNEAEKAGKRIGGYFDPRNWR